MRLGLGCTKGPRGLLQGVFKGDFEGVAQENFPIIGGGKRKLMLTGVLAQERAQESVHERAQDKREYNIECKSSTREDFKREGKRSYALCPNR